MNNFKVGEITPTKLYMGEIEVTKAYMGEILVYEKESSSGETWVLNDSIGVKSDGSTPTFTINFVSNTQDFTSITIGKKERLTYDSTVVYEWGGSGWTDTAYRTITFETAPTGDLLTWLQANGTKQ